ncbi:N-terminal domain of MutM-like DNA repair protein [Hesseltinella vesiculosa]|uniref:N-terminal domain of MutM-like DNA repair protein n=1 Tax=Hesseltinella vesiculosa TaxID=101127 RepID=A0A1X2GE15_9FUNG|nr:N-terminal domain of MutM-like DNA repair protein [Hesseltinella vesiculosa]
MPEIAEVEAARRLCHKFCLDRPITNVETIEDKLVFVDKDHTDFKKILIGRTIVDTKRWGKYFALVFDTGPAMVCHFGMTGSLKFKATSEEWPPRFHKLVLTFDHKKKNDVPPVVMAFCDARRLGRLRLVEGDPMTQEPISKLGFDPLVNLPKDDEFYTLIHKRSVPIKALLLDQAFSAGVGNWIADEILFHARIHPAQYTNTLTTDQCKEIRKQMLYVCEVAVEAEADESILPDHWLMTYRWNKGKGKGKGKLPNGHTLAFETVGGRTSAFVPALQKLTSKPNTNKKPKRPAVSKKEDKEKTSSGKRKNAEDEPTPKISRQANDEPSTPYKRRSQRIKN